MKIRKWLIYKLLVKPELDKLIKVLKTRQNLDDSEYDYMTILAMFEKSYFGINNSG